MSISNLQTFDAFADAEQEDIATKQSGAVHVRIQQRNGRKTLTTVQGLSPEIDYQKLLRAFKKSFNTNGSITEHPEHGSCIQLQGDQRFKVAQFLEEEGLVAKDKLKIHGF